MYYWRLENIIDESSQANFQGKSRYLDNRVTLYNVALNSSNLVNTWLR